MCKEEIFTKLEELAVIPVIVIDSVDAALPLADALLEGGLPVAEITFRTKAAAKAIATLKRERPDMLVGAGTVINKADMNSASECGADFAVAPGSNPDIIRGASVLGLPFIPGVATPSEIETAMSLGARVLKYYPAEVNGGTKALKAVSGPYSHTGIKFMPTGGINPGNLAGYISMNIVSCVGGTWIASKDMISQGLWFEISENCRQACELVNNIRLETGNATLVK